MGQEKLLFVQNKMKYGTKSGHLLEQEKLILGHNKMKYGAEQKGQVAQQAVHPPRGYREHVWDDFLWVHGG